MMISPLITVVIMATTAGAASTVTAFVETPVSISFTGGSDDYYNVPVTVGGQPLDVRLDINQPELWVMDERSFEHCSNIDAWWSSVESQYPSSLPETVTTASYFTAGACLRASGYVPPASMASPLVAETNGAPATVPYVASINASGEWATDRVGIDFTNGSAVVWENFTFIDVDDTTLLYGGFGLATNPRGSGILTSFQRHRYIKSPGYSLWFSNTSRYDVNGTDKHGIIIPGVVDPSRFQGTLYSFPVVGHKGYRYQESDNYDNSVVGNLNLPIVVLDDLELLNREGGSVSFIANTNVAPFPVILNSRSIFSFLPNSIVIDLAIQTNAYFSADVNRWLVGCDAIRGASARLRFKFNDLEITLPLEDLIEDVYYGGKQIKFQDDKDACTLLVLSSDRNGAAALGLPFLEHVYTVMDNEGGNLALAQRADPINDDDSDDKSSDKTSTRSNSTDNSSATRKSGVTVSHKSSTKSAAFIENGFIPYAESVTTDTSYVFTYSQVNPLVIDNSQVPARFSGALVSNGDYIITGYYATGSGVSTVNSNLASSSSNDGGSGSGTRAIPGATGAVGMAVVWTMMGLIGVICMI